MTKSFLNFLLPNDEYKKEQLLYFLAEAAVLAIVFSVLLAVINHYFIQAGLTTALLLIPVFMLLYIHFRYTFAGIEHTTIFTNNAYKKKRRSMLLQAIGSGVMFFILLTIFGGFPASSNDWYNNISVSLLFMLFLFLVNFLSLRSSYKKNKDILED